MSILRDGVVDLSAIDRERFVVSPRVVPGVGDVVLINPGKAMFDWHPGEEVLRSLLVRPDGRVVSAGLPKFFNLGERPDHDALGHAAAVAGRVRFGEKLDGSLVVRSVIDGRVVFRTRGSHELGDDFREPVMRLVRERHDRLLDPTYVPHRSALMEYTGPANRVVLLYDEPCLTAIGEVTHDDVRPHLPTFAGLCAMACPAEHRGDGLASVAAEVRAWSGREGLVAWCFRDDGAPVLLKVKSAEYLRLHAMRSELNERRVWMLCAVAGASTFEACRGALEQVGLDWEDFAFAEPWLRSYLARREANRTALAEIRRTVRGDVARGLKAACAKAGRPDLFGVAMHAAVGEDDRAAEMLRAADVDDSVSRMRAEVAALRTSLAALLDERGAA